MTFNYSEASWDNLSTCHKDLIILFKVVLKSYDHTVACGFRDREDQNRAFRDGSSQLSWPKSKHNKVPSMAVDVYPYHHGIELWDEDNARHFAGYVQGVAEVLQRIGVMKHGIRWGGDWDQDNNSEPSESDLGHFELVTNE